MAIAQRDPLIDMVRAPLLLSAGRNGRAMEFFGANLEGGPKIEVNYLSVEPPTAQQIQRFYTCFRHLTSTHQAGPSEYR